MFHVSGFNVHRLIGYKCFPHSNIAQINFDVVHHRSFKLKGWVIDFTIVLLEKPSFHLGHCALFSKASVLGFIEKLHHFISALQIEAMHLHCVMKF